MKLKNNKSLKYIYTISLGDVGGDGHGKYKKLIIKTSHRNKDIGKAYLQSVKNSGISLNNICQDYQDHTIKKDDLDKLESFGIDIKSFINYPDIENNNGNLAMDIDDFFKLVLDFIKLSLPKFQYEILDIEDLNLCYRGDYSMGYGLFD